MDILYNREQRLKKYERFALEKNTLVSCPVCNRPFLNRYSLANHFFVKGYSSGTQYLDKNHEAFWFENKLKEKEKHLSEVKERKYEHICVKCKNIFVMDYDHRFQKKCTECLIKFPPKKKGTQKEFKIYPCYRCGSFIKIKKCGNNKICDECKKREREQEIQRILDTPKIINCLKCGKPINYYRRHVHDRLILKICDDCKKDEVPFKSHPRYEKVIQLLKETTLTRREIKKLLGLEIDYIREAAINEFGKVWYEERVKKIRKRGLLQAIYQRPSGLEAAFSKNLSIPFKANKWLILKIEGENCRTEIDLKVPVGERKFAILIDGESFHGSNKFYNKDRVDINGEDMDNVKAKVLSDMGYFTIRYSETEVKSGWANEHFFKKYSDFLKCPPSYYYRNWITGEEIIKN